MNLILKEEHRFAKKIASFVCLAVFACLTTYASAATPVTGKVTDVSGDPLVGVNVTVKGEPTLGGMTDIEGLYTISVPDRNATLVFSYLGFITQEINVNNQSVINLTMSEAALSINEVVIVGYGTQKKANLTGAVSQVNSKIFESRPVSSTITAMQGTLSGVYIAPTNGNPNQDLSINVRGTTSINGGSPLVLVDGIESSLKLVNPNDIETISVLKDASAASIYGVRGAFGVVLITTKKGSKDGKLSINYSGNYALSKATYMPEFVDNSYDHVMFVNQSCLNNGVAVLYPQVQVDAIKAKMENPSLPDYIFVGTQYRPVGYRNWKEELIEDYSPRRTHSLSISGGNGSTNFYLSTSYLNQEGVLKINPDVYNRYNARAYVENNTYKWLKVSLKALYNTAKMDQPHTYANDIYRAILYSSPLQGGQWLGDPNYPEYDYLIGRYFQDQNQTPLLLYGGRDILQQREITLTPSVDIMPLKGWNIHFDYNYNFLLGYDTYNTKNMSQYFLNNAATGLVAHPGPSTTDSYNIRESQKLYSSINLYSDYEFSLAQVHHFKLMAGFNQESTVYNYITATRNTMLNPDLPSLSLGTGDQAVTQTGYEWALRGGFARVNYDYDSRYLLELSGRYDGTSRFPKDNRFVFLPSFSVGWRLSEEKFMTFAKPIFDNIKFRYSYGMLGNQMLTSSVWSGNMRYYPYIPFLTSGTSSYYLFGNVGTDKTINPPTSLLPASLTWEKVTTSNLGLDLSLLASRLDLSFEVFTRTTSDMLLQQTYPEVLGASAPVENSGELQTKGWEFQAGWRDHIGDVSYRVGFNIYDAQAEITKWKGGTGVVTDYYAGKKVGEIWGYVTDDHFLTAADFVDGDVTKALLIPQAGYSTWKPGDIKYKDRDGNGAINTGDNTPENPGDRIVIGNSTPRYNYSITGEVSYKGFSLNVFLQGIGKRDLFPTDADFWPDGNNQYYNTQKRFITDSWTPDNTDTYYAMPRPRSAQNQQSQTKYLQDASYLRLKNLTIGYDFPKAWLNKVYLSRAQIYLSGENLWEKQNRVGPYDPEFSGSDYYAYPFQRVYSVGLNLTF
ncbi:MAG: TonB-dependent receptor [Candidatus Symbiothrix sp.]|jgi:TonB-linked SusC/RagA family outer membrane protein|nr:TonB-dependent receptor [Candidatus Symbiothrix sp.]